MRMTDEQYSDFKKKCKLYFSSLSARGTQFAYFNIPIPCDIVLSNSTSPRPRTKKNGVVPSVAETIADRTLYHGDRLTHYSVTDLSMHLLDIADTTFVRDLRRILCVPDGVYYTVNIVKFTSMLNNIPRDALSIYLDSEMNLIMAHKETNELDPNKHYIGHVVVDYHVVSRIRYYVDIAYDTVTVDHANEYPSVIKNINPEHVLMTGRLFFMELDTWDYTNEDGSMVFPNSRQYAQILCLDGLTCVSLKEFLPKVKKTDYTLDILAWAVDSAYILSVSRFENKDIKVLSFRPNIVTYPCPNMPVGRINLGELGTADDE